MTNKTKLAALYSLATALTLGVSNNAFGQSVIVNETLVDGNLTDQIDPSVSGSVVVFTDGRFGGTDLSYVVPPAFPVTFAIGASTQESSSISGSSIVFTDDALGNRNINLFDIGTATTALLDGNLADDFSPAISGNNVVFLSDRGGTLSVHWLQIGGGFPSQLSSGTVINEPPDIDANLAVWTENVAGSLDIVGAFVGSAPFSIANSASLERKPSVSGTLVAYLIDGDVEVIDITTSQRTTVTNDAVAQTAVQISGQNVVYSDSSSGNEDLYLHNLATGTTTQLTTDPSDQVLGDLDGNTLVFEDDRLGNKNIWRIDFSINTPPAADAGPDQTETLGATVQLAGNGSDTDGDPIVTFTWTLDAAPLGSTAMLSNPNIANPIFDPDLAGDYTFSLVVSDGLDPSAPDTVVVSIAEKAMDIDLGPPGPVDVINLGGRAQVVAVTVLGSATLDVDDVDVASLSFQGAPSLDGGVPVDANGDPFPDLLLFFEKSALSPLELGSQQVCLNGTVAGVTHLGCVLALVVLNGGCGLGFELALLLPGLAWLRGRRRRGARSHGG